ncbi:hypothetical protein J437_LFUL002151 [Ladona fulva]|uniref:Intraflagellar transport protein 52-like protein n=1 Tax=Ladona fulva TaxID=123851 RepID=A0A8K0JZ02_LADFU|nr:hypothetical protein J437_LFUL002151 [Ladona fulva]
MSKSNALLKYRNKEEVTEEVLEGCSVFVLPGPREKFTESEFNCMKSYLSSGGNILVLLGEGGEKAFQTNINFLLEEYGIMINNGLKHGNKAVDSVIRTHYYKYFHPKECLVMNGVLNKGIEYLARKLNHSFSANDEANSKSALPFVYPFGATLNVARPAVAILSSGSSAYPANRPVCAFYGPNDSKSENDTSDGGRIAVMGSLHVFSDAYLEREANRILLDILFRYLSDDRSLELNKVDAEDPEEIAQPKDQLGLRDLEKEMAVTENNAEPLEVQSMISDYYEVPDTAQLSERLRVCLQESDEIPTDNMKLFNQKLFSISGDKVPDVLEAYSLLNVKYEPLKLIKPQFETPLPALQCAVFPPSFRDLPPPPLELFDLDEAFSSETSRLAQLANKCIVGEKEVEGDFEYFIRECGNILNIPSQLEEEAPKDARHILYHVALHISEFRKLNSA